MFDNDEIVQAIGHFHLMCCTLLVVLDLEEEEAEEEEKPDILALTLAVGSFRRLRKRTLQPTHDEEVNPPNERKKHDHERACRCIQQDCLGPDPLHGGQFERIFRATRGIFEKASQVCGQADVFFTHRFLKNSGELGVYPEARILMALKVLGCGCSSSAFIDCFQMGSTSGRDCVKRFCKVIAHSDLRGRHPRPMTPADARAVAAMHEEEFGIPGLIGCLDCMHIFWKNCPVAWQGQCSGKEGSPTLALEGPSDYNLRLWNFKEGFPGTLNDINVWERSGLSRAFLDGTFTKHVDFEFTIAGKIFNELFLSVDGIYPDLSRFVKTFACAFGPAEKRLSEWQEKCRKSVERAFGVAQRKFQMLTRPVELWCESEISDVVVTCFVLHDMMVEVRLEREQRESDAWYNAIEDEEGEDEEQSIGGNDEFIGRHAVDIDSSEKAPECSLRHKIQKVREEWPFPGDEQGRKIREVMKEHVDNAQAEWHGPHDSYKHPELRKAIMDQLEIDSKKKKKDQPQQLLMRVNC